MTWLPTVTSIGGLAWVIWLIATGRLIQGDVNLLTGKPFWWVRNRDRTQAGREPDSDVERT